MILRTFKSVFADAKVLENHFKTFIEDMDLEIIEEKNWIMPFSDFMEILYNVLHAKSYNKLFIWDDEIHNDEGESELDIMIRGLFLPMLWTEIHYFYKNQLTLKDKDLFELSQWMNRGDLSFDDNEGAQSAYSQPTKNGYKWDDTKDGPSFKQKTENTSYTANRIKDIQKMLKTRICVYFVDLFYMLEPYFLDKGIAESWK